MDGNKNIAEYGKATRFGQPNGPDPAKASAKEGAWKIRNALRRLAAAEIDITKPLTLEEIAKQFGTDGVKMTLAQYSAAKKFHQAMSNWKAMDSLIDHVDGKQVEKVVEAKVTLADLVNGSYQEQLDDASGEGSSSEDQTVA